MFGLHNFKNQLLMKDLQQWWEIPCIGQFVSLFRIAFNLPEIDIEELEESLIEDGGKGNKFLSSLLISLLQGLYPRRSITFSNWETYLRRILERKWVNQEKKHNPLPEDEDFSQLKLRTKVEIIYCLCLYRLDCDDAAQAMKSMDAETLRVQSLGTDDQGNVYWYFYGTRLYKEEPSPSLKTKGNWKEYLNKSNAKNEPLKRGRGRPKKHNFNKSDGESDESDENNGNKNYLTLDSKSRWSVVCTTLEEWKIFADQFKESKSKNETALFKIVSANFLPVLSEMYAKKGEQVRALLKASSNDSSKNGNRKRKCNISSSAKILKKRRYSSEEETEVLEQRTKRLREKNFIEANEISNDRADKNISNAPDLMLKLKKILSMVKLHKDAWPFLYPVKETDAPDYYNIIKEPIDLQAIERKVELRVYNSLQQVESDFQKLVSNCQLYNGENSAYTSMAKTVWRVFKKGVAQLMGEIAAFSDQNTNQKVESTDTLGHKADARKSTRYSAKKKRSAHSKTKEGLEMLANASEDALKEVGITEGELFVKNTSEMKSKDFPDLNVVTIQNHPPSFIARLKRSSTSSSSSFSSATSSEDESKSSDNQISYPQKSKNAVSEDELFQSDPNEKPISPDSCGNINRISTPVDSNESSLESSKSLKELSANCHVLDMPGDTQTISFRDNISSLLCRIIKENQVFPLSDNSDVEMSTETCSGPPSLEPLLPLSKECSKSKSSDGDDSNSCLLAPPQLNSVHDLLGLPPLENITTVDASAIGITVSATVGKSSSQTSSISDNCTHDSSNKIEQAEVTNVESSTLCSVSSDPAIITNSKDSSEIVNNVEAQTVEPETVTSCSPYPAASTPEIVSTPVQETASPTSTYTDFILSRANENAINSLSLSSASLPPLSSPPSWKSLKPQFNGNDINSLSLSSSAPLPPLSSPPSWIPHKSQFNENSINSLSLPSSASLPPLSSPPSLRPLVSPHSPMLSCPSSSPSDLSLYSVSSPPQHFMNSTTPNNSFNSEILPTFQSPNPSENNNQNNKMPNKQILAPKTSSKKDGNSRQIKKKRSVAITHNHNSTNITTKTVYESVLASEQFIPTQETALCKLSSLVSNTHAKFNEKDAQNGSNLNTKVSSLFVPYASDNEKLPSFWNGKEVQPVQFPMFQHPPSINVTSSLPANVNFCVNSTRPIFTGPTSTQPIIFNPSNSAANIKSGNIFASVQMNPPTSHFQSSRSPEISPPQKFNDAFYPSFGIQNAQTTTQMIPQSFVSISPSSYVLPGQPSMMVPSLISNTDTRPQFTMARNMPVYTILQSMPPPKIFQ